jgi:predicted ATPase
MNEIRGRLFVITGGPGSGKTTLIKALATHGHRTTVEAGRAIIREQTEVGGSALPWLNAAAFADLMLSREIHSYRRASATSGLVFFDRGIPDVVGFLRLMSLPVPPLIDRAARELRYDRRVFIAPPWEDIFEQDTERRQTFAQAVATYEAMVQVYTGSGYDLTPLPRAPVDERVAFVLHSVKGPDGHV